MNLLLFGDQKKYLNKIKEFSKTLKDKCMKNKKNGPRQCFNMPLHTNSEIYSFFRQIKQHRLNAKAAI